MNALRAADVTKILTRREMQTVLADLKRKTARSKNTRLNLVIFRLAACCGLRASEIAQLVMADVRVAMPRPHIRIRCGAAKERWTAPMSRCSPAVFRPRCAAKRAG